MDNEQLRKENLRFHFWFLAAVSAFLVITFVYYLPLRFEHSAMGAGNHEEGQMMGGDMMEHMDDHSGMDEMMGGHGHGGNYYHEIGDVTQGLAVDLTSPEDIETGEAADFVFFANDRPSRKPISDLELEHEKYIHVLGLREDLNEFFHIHPEPVLDEEGNPLPGMWTVPYEFQKPGNYKLWVDATRNGETHSFGYPSLSVSGPGTTSSKQVAFGTSAIVSDHQVELHYDLPIRAGRDTDLSFDIHDARGNEIDVEPYLGADMHLAAIKDDLKSYIHTHPEGGAHEHSKIKILPIALANGGGHDEGDETIGFHVTFPEPGLYKLFAQFRPKGIDLPEDESLTADFWIRVEEPATGLEISPWWRNLLVSLVLLALLSWGVKRFITVPLETVKKQ